MSSLWLKKPLGYQHHYQLVKKVRTIMEVSRDIKRLSMSAFLFFFALFATKVFADDVQQGIAAYKQRDFKTAYQAWHKAAQQNVTEAQWMLAILLLNGQGVEQDKAAAYSWLTLASEKKHKQAIIDRMAIRDRLSSEELARAESLSEAFRNKQTAKTAIKQQKEKAFHLFEKGAKQGDPQAQYQLGEMLLNGEGIKQDKVAAYAWFSLASEQNQPQAIVKQAQLKTELSSNQIEKANVLILANRDNHLINDAPPELPDISIKTDVNDIQSTAAMTAGYALQPTLEKASAPTPKKSTKPDNVKNKQKVSDVNEQAVTVYRVQVGAFKSRENVDIALAQLTKISATTVQKYQTTITEPVENTIKPDFYRLQLGNFSAKPEAAKLCQFLKQNKQPCFVVSSQR